MSVSPEDPQFEVLVYQRVGGMLLFQHGSRRQEPNSAERDEIIDYVLSHPARMEDVVTIISRGVTNPERVKALAEDIASHAPAIKEGYL